MILFIVIVILSMAGEAPEEALKDALAQADAKWLLLQTEAGQHRMRQRCPACPLQADATSTDSHSALERELLTPKTEELR